MKILEKLMMGMALAGLLMSLAGCCCLGGSVDDDDILPGPPHNQGTGQT